jgi:hypothetical protein
MSRYLGEAASVGAHRDCRRGRVRNQARRRDFHHYIEYGLVQVDRRWDSLATTAVCVASLTQRLPSHGRAKVQTTEVSVMMPMMRAAFSTCRTPSCGGASVVPFQDI